MNLEFLVVGVARESLSDLKELYEATCDEVYGVAISIVKDKNIAKNVLIETYKRVYSLAYLFDTDLSAEYWILDMAKNIANNALHDPVIKAVSQKPMLDNASKLLIDTLTVLKNDRPAIVMLKSISGISYKDMARMLWYHTGSLKSEYKRGIKQLLAADKTRSDSDISKTLREDIRAITPDVWPQLAQMADTPLSHISHEELNLSEEELIYSEEDKEKALIKKRAAAKKRNKRILITACILAVIIVANIIVLSFTDLLKKNEEKNGEIEVDVQFGNKIAIVQIDDTVFYQNHRDDSHLWRMDLTDKNAQMLSEDKVKELTTDGTRLFYRNASDGKIYSILPDGSDKKCLSDTPGTNIILYNDLLYFSAGDGIYKMNPDGSGREQVVSLTDDAEDVVYYATMELDVYRYDMNITESGELYFSAGAGKGIYKVTHFEEKAGIEAIYMDEAYTFQIIDDKLYFDIKSYPDGTNPETRLYALAPAGGEPVMIENVVLGTGAFYITGNTLYFDGCTEDSQAYGIYAFDLENGTTKKITDLRASDIYIAEGRLYLYLPEKSGAYLKAIDLNSGEETGIF